MTMRAYSRERQARSLPVGYQFGDAAWRAPHENAAERLADRTSLPLAEPRRPYQTALRIERERHDAS